MPYVRATKETLKFLAAVAVGSALLWAGQTVLSWREAAQANEQAERKAEATVGIIEDGAAADEDRDTTDAGVDAGRSVFNDSYDEGVRNEPQTAARADRAVPQRVRDAYRERRLSRERSGCAGEQCQP